MTQERKFDKNLSHQHYSNQQQHQRQQQQIENAETGNLSPQSIISCVNMSASMMATKAVVVTREMQQHDLQDIKDVENANNNNITCSDNVRKNFASYQICNMAKFYLPHYKNLQIYGKKSIVKKKSFF